MFTSPIGGACKCGANVLSCRLMNREEALQKTREINKNDTLLSGLWYLFWVVVGDIFSRLNYYWGDPRYTEKDGRIEYTPLSQLYAQPECDDPMYRRYFHRSSERGCGCGYDGVYIYPSQCPMLFDEIAKGMFFLY